MTIEKLITLGQGTLHKDQTRLILATLLNMNPLELTLHLNKDIDDEIVQKFKNCLKALDEGLPLQYALRETNFYGLNFYVDKRVLIPRFETEELVYNTNNYIKKYFQKPVKILDLCTGSGCIGLTLKSFSQDYLITLSDISYKALEVARINQEKLNLEVNLVQSDLFSNINEQFDVIISNPPYVSKDDTVDEIVLKNEPHLALYAKNDGLEFYEKILSNCEKYLNSKYLIAFEIGNTQREKVVKLINKYLKNIEIITKVDASGRDRMIFIFKNIEINE